MSEVDVLSCAVPMSCQHFEASGHNPQQVSILM